MTNDSTLFHKKKKPINTQIKVRNQYLFVFKKNKAKHSLGKEMKKKAKQKKGLGLGGCNLSKKAKF